MYGRIFEDVIPSSSGDTEENLWKVPVMQPRFEMVFFLVNIFSVHQPCLLDSM
jgi:hypothetical protein